MRTFTFFVRDSRSDVPIIDFAVGEGESWAIKLAIDKLELSTGYESVDVFENDKLKFRVAAARRHRDRAEG